MAEKPTLGYWNISGLGDIFRTLLHHLGVDFEDKRYVIGCTVPGESWAECKPNLGMAFPNLPYFKDGDVYHAETQSVLRSICRKYKPEYLGRTLKEQCDLDAYAGAIFGGFWGWFMPHMFAEDYKEKKEEGTRIVKEQLTAWTAIIGENRFFMGSELTYLDFYIHWRLKIYKLYDENILDEFPKLVEYLATMQTQDGVEAAAKTQEGLMPFAPRCAWMKDHTPE